MTTHTVTLIPAASDHHAILKHTFGHDHFRPLQREIIENILAGRDTLAVMPTGGGKSLCYQIPALIFDGLTVVVSPLIALMKDQVEQMQAIGVPALFINSTLSTTEYNANMQSVRQGKTKLLYVAPESLLTPHILELLASTRVDCLTIDEAHCISDWGHDFRPDYRQLREIRPRHPRATCLALTATATPRVRSDIESALDFKHSQRFIAGFNRPNLFIEVKPKCDAFGQTTAFLQRHHGEAGIIYCFTRRQVEELAGDLHHIGIPARPYHAGLNDESRRINQESFIRGETRIIVATIAFGMGINKSNVRFVLHYDVPKSLENYYQEIGRAGRDGAPAHCLMLYSYEDAMRLRRLLMKKTGNERMIAMDQLSRIISFAENHRWCRRKPILEHFGEAWDHPSCLACDVCTGGTRTGLAEPEPSVTKTTISFRYSRTALHPCRPG